MEVARHLSSQTLRAGPVIARPGDPADCLYLIVSGEVLVQPENRGKGAALRTACEHLLARGCDAVVSVGTWSMFPYIVEPVLLAKQRGGSSAATISSRSASRCTTITTR